MSLAKDYFEMIPVTGECNEHGHWQLKVPRRFAAKARCPACSREQSERANAERKRFEDERKRGMLYDAAKIPARYRRKSLSDFIPDEKSEKAFDLCKRYAAKFDRVLEDGISLCFCGKPGTGKTHLAIGLIHEAIRNGISAEYRTVIEMIREVKQTYSRDASKTELQVIQHYSSVQLLVLDEVGMQFGSDTEKLILSEIINNRYANVLPTILISNLGLAELKKYLGDRIVDRMREGGGAVISFDWESKRGSI